MKDPNYELCSGRNRLMFELSVYMHAIIRKLTPNEVNSDSPNKILFILRVQRTASLKKLCEILGVSTSAGSIMVDKYVKAGLVARNPDPQDRRKIVLSLTPEGRTLIDKCTDVLYQNLNHSFQSLSEEENEEFYNALATTAKYIQQVYPSVAKCSQTEQAGAEDLAAKARTQNG